MSSPGFESDGKRLAADFARYKGMRGCEKKGCDCMEASIVDGGVRSVLTQLSTIMHSSQKTLGDAQRNILDDSTRKASLSPAFTDSDDITVLF